MGQLLLDGILSDFARDGRLDEAVFLVYLLLLLSEVENPAEGKAAGPREERWPVVIPGRANIWPERAIRVRGEAPAAREARGSPREE